MIYIRWHTSESGGIKAKKKKKKRLKVLFVCTCLYTFQECGEWRAGDNRGLVFVGLSPAHPVD